MQNVELKTKAKKESFKCKNATNCDIEPNHLSSPTIAWNSLVEPNLVV